MKRILIRNLNQPQISPISAKYCNSFFCILRGLTFRRSIPPNFGLLLVFKGDNRVESAIHMMFVWMDLSIIWINSSFNVVDVKLARRWRPLYIPRRPAKYVLELLPERLSDFKIGDRVDFSDL